MHQIPQKHMLMRMEQLASIHIWIPNEWSSVLFFYLRRGPQATTAHSPRVYNQHIQYSAAGPSYHKDMHRAFFPCSSDIYTHSSRKRKYSFLVSKTSTSWRMLGCFTLRRCVTKHKTERGTQREREREWCQESHRRWCLHQSFSWRNNVKTCFNAHK